MKPAAIKALERELLPLAALITPNVDEAAAMTDRTIRSVEDLRGAAREIKRRFGCAALVKGGHLRGMKEAVDVFYDGKLELLLTAPFVPQPAPARNRLHDSAAITAHLALGADLPTAVSRAKKHITGAISASRKAGSHAVLDNFWQKWG